MMKTAYRLISKDIRFTGDYFAEQSFYEPADQQRWLSRKKLLEVMGLCKMKMWKIFLDYMIARHDYVPAKNGRYPKSCHLADNGAPKVVKWNF